MSVAAYISALETDRNIIRNKLIELGLAVSTDKLDKLAAIIEGIVNQGAVNATVQEGDTYTIPAGFHNGNGTVSGISGGGNYTLQTKAVTPTKRPNSVAPDPGYYGLSSVAVGAIPEAYQDVSSVTATPDSVLAGRIYVASDGTVTPGEMINNGAIDETINADVISYTIPKGFHNGSGRVKIVLETKEVTPSKDRRVIVPSSGKVLSSVVVEPIPDKYVDTSDATASPAHILDGQVAYVGTERVEGEMPNIGAINIVLDVNTPSADISEGYHDGFGSVSISIEEKNIVPKKEAQEFSPSPGKVIGFVTVDAIPDEYVDTRDATALPAHILEGEVAYVGPQRVEGEMPNIGRVDKILDVNATSYQIPKGYHNGEGQVSISTETGSATPKKEIQEIFPTSGKVISKFVVDPIPEDFQDVTGVTATTGDVLDGTYFVDKNGVLKEGTMVNRGAINATIDGLTTTVFTIPPGKHNGSGTVSLTDDIEKALAAI